MVFIDNCRVLRVRVWVFVVILIALFALGGCSRGGLTFRENRGTISLPFGLAIRNATGESLALVKVGSEDGRIFEDVPDQFGFTNMPIAVVGRTNLRITAVFQNGEKQCHSVVVDPKRMRWINMSIGKEKAWVDSYEKPNSSGKWVFCNVCEGVDENDPEAMVLIMPNRDRLPLSPSGTEFDISGFGLKDDAYRHGIWRLEIRFQDGRVVSHSITANLDNDELFYLIIMRDGRLHLWRKSEIIPRGSWKAVSS